MYVETVDPCASPIEACAEDQAPGELPSISIVIPVRNDAERLAVCLASLQEQNYPTELVEIIVVDNGSTDRSAEVATQFGARVAIAPILKVGALRNLGVSMARGKVLAFVDSDHEVPPQWLTAAVSRLLRSPATAIAGSPCRAPAEGTWVQRGWERHRLRKKDVHTTDWLGAGNLFMRKSDFQQIGGFREDLVAAEDVDLCLRTAATCGEIVCDPAIENVHHGEPKTLVDFFRKEYWRGSSGLKAFFGQGCPWRELPTLVYPAWHLIAFLGFVAAMTLFPWHRTATWILLALIMLLAPATLLALLTSVKGRSLTAFFQLMPLYLTYGLARAAALFRF